MLRKNFFLLLICIDFVFFLVGMRDINAACVRVYQWRPKGDFLGHCSIEIDKHYFSLVRSADDIEQARLKRDKLPLALVSGSLGVLAGKGILSVLPALDQAGFLGAGVVAGTTLGLYKAVRVVEKFGPQYFGSRPASVVLTLKEDIEFNRRKPDFCYKVDVSEQVHNWIMSFLAFNALSYDEIQGREWIPLTKTRYAFVRSYALDLAFDRPPFSLLTCSLFVYCMLFGPESQRTACLDIEEKNRKSGKAMPRIGFLKNLRGRYVFPNGITAEELEQSLDLLVDERKAEKEVWRPCLSSKY